MKPYEIRAHTKQRGIVLLLVVLILLAIGATTLFVGIASNNAVLARQQQRAGTDNETLLAAKSALIGWLVQKTDGGSGSRLGNLPTPDSLAYGAYSGRSDTLTSPKCLSNSGTGVPGIALGGSGNVNMRCLGKFPWRDLSLELAQVETHDPLGNVPWLAVSANLIWWEKCLDILNSDILNWIYPGSFTSCPSAAGVLPYPWLTVRDENGNVLSNKVAAVLILPGPAIATGNRTQARSAASLGNPADYLDAISLPLGCSASCAATYDNADLTNQFIRIPPGTRYPANAEDASKAGQALSFNDTLIYLTVDELIPYVERRVLSEMSKAIADTKVKTGGYPWAATFASPASYTPFKSLPGTSFGLFPFFIANTLNFDTDFNWQINGVSTLAKSCVRVLTGPSRYVDIRQHVRTDYYSGSINNGAVVGASCYWKGIPSSGFGELECDPYTSTAGSPLNKAFTLYSNSTCTTVNAGSPINYSVTRTVTVDLTPKCNTASPGNLVGSYQTADATRTQRFTWTCGSVSSSTSVFTVGASDTISILISPFTRTGSFSISAVGQNASISNMRYQPLMPSWFYTNEWYKTAFYSVAPSKAPSSVTPCNATQLLAAGTNANVDAIVLLAGAKLAGQAARPSAAIADYLESPNVTAGTTCLFSTPGTTVNDSFDDQLVVVAP